MRRVALLPSMVMLLALCGSAVAIPTAPSSKPSGQQIEKRSQAVAAQPVAGIEHSFVTEFYGPTASPAAAKPQKSLLKRAWNRVVSAVTFR